MSISYENPPVSETSVGVAFAPLQGWDVHLFGALLEAVRERYFRFQSAEPLTLQVPNVQVRFSTSAPIRGLYFSADNTRLIQAQDNLFFVNWRKLPHSAVYPRYSQLRKRFSDDWATFCALLERERIAAPVVTRYQLAYVNIVPHAEALPARLFTQWSAPDGISESEVALTSSYRLLSRATDVSLSLQPALRVEDNTSVSQLTIVVGRNEVDQKDPVLHFDELHETLIETFQSITDSNAQRIWRPFHE